MTMTEHNVHGHGIVIGRFMPPHVGHAYLIEYARRFSSSLSILVCTLSHEPIDGTLRHSWMQTLFPECEVIHVTEEIPDAQRDKPGAVEIWARYIRKAVHRGISWVFASEAYGNGLAAALKAEFIPVDPSRTNFPISAQRIRENPWKYWEYLTEPVRRYYLRTVCVITPEAGNEYSPARFLARRYNTLCASDPFVLWNTLRPDVDQAVCTDLIQKAGRASFETLAGRANRILFREVASPVSSPVAETPTQHPPYRKGGPSYCPDPFPEADLYILHDPVPGLVEKCQNAFGQDRVLRLDASESADDLAVRDAIDTLLRPDTAPRTAPLSNR
jgi:cytidyltransferase-like protein